MNNNIQNILSKKKNVVSRSVHPLDKSRGNFEPSYKKKNEFRNGSDVVKIMSLGGFGDVTQNMYVYHYLPNGKEENDSILIVDVGVGFPEEDIFGVDLIIPDFNYVSRRRDKIVGILLTHGHEDHIGALPLFLREINKSMNVYGSKLTLGFANEKTKEFGSPVKYNQININDKLKLGPFEIEPIRVTHSIPDAYHYFISTPVGNFYHASDFKFDLTPPDGKGSQLEKIGRMGRRNILAIMSDCLGSERDGFTTSERDLAGMFDKHIGSAKGRVFVTAISSNLYRWQQAIDSSKKYGRKICLVGMSVEKNIKMAKRLGFMNYEDSDLVKPKKIKGIKDSQITVLIAGSLGQTGSSLDKVVVGKHPCIKAKPGDKVIFSSPDYIPGTSTSIYDMIDNLIKIGVDVVYHENEENLHVSGHASKQELALLLELTRPRYIVPIGANYRHIKQFENLTKKLEFPQDSFIIPKEDQVLNFGPGTYLKKEEKLVLRKVLVDGLGVGDVGETVLRDRKVLAEEGMIVAILIFDTKNKKLASDPQVMSRGFVYVRQSEELIKSISNLSKDVFNEIVQSEENFSSARKQIQGKIEEMVVNQTGRQPMVLPIIIEV